MAVSLQPTGPDSRPITSHSSAFSKTLSRVGTRTAETARSVWRALKKARMMSVLENMTDQQLSQIGISRSDIPRHAERLISDG